MSTVGHTHTHILYRVVYACRPRTHTHPITHTLWFVPVGFQQRLVHPGRLSAPNARAGAGTHPADGRRCPVNAPRIAHPAAWPAVPSRPRHAMPCHAILPCQHGNRFDSNTGLGCPLLSERAMCLRLILQCGFMTGNTNNKLPTGHEDGLNYHRLLSVSFNINSFAH